MSLLSQHVRLADGRTRLLYIRHEGPLTTVRTKGDANRSADPDASVIVGKTLTPVYVVPLMGYLVAKASTPAGWLAMVVLPALALAVRILAGAWRRQEKRGVAEALPGSILP